MSPFTVLMQIILIGLETGLPLTFTFLGVYLIFRLLDDFDLTVQGTFPMGGATVAVLLSQGIHPIPATIIAVLIGCLAGLVTGLMYARLQISLLMSGIISMIALYSVNLHIMGRPNTPILNVPTVYSWADAYSGMAYSVAVSGFLLVLVLVLAAALIYFLKTEIGLAIRATGGNPTMARSMGVNTAAITVLCVVLANGLVAFSGALAAQDQGFADVSMGTGAIVAGIASILLGELVVRKPTRVARGVVAVLIGTFLYRLLFTIALRLGLEPYDLQLFTALVLLGAIAAPKGFKYLTQRPLDSRVRRLFLARRETRLQQEGLDNAATGKH